MDAAATSTSFGRKEALAVTEPLPDIEASQSFHRRVVARLRAEQSGSLWNGLATRLAGARLSWRTAVSLLGATAILLVLVFVQWREPARPSPLSTRVQAVLPAAPNERLSPTISNYERVANRSLDELDDLLTRQANRRPSPPPSTPPRCLWLPVRQIESPFRLLLLWASDFRLRRSAPAPVLMRQAEKKSAPARYTSGPGVFPARMWRGRPLTSFGLSW